MKIKSILTLGMAALLVLVTGCQPQAVGSQLSASLSELKGLVELKQAGQDAFEQAAADSVLEVDGQVQTGDDGRVRLDLSSGTIIRVAPSSSFILTSNDPVEGGLLTRLKLEAGKIFIILNGGQTDVETPSGVASVRGSYLKVEIDPVTKDIHITCLEGTCSATNPNGEQIIFTNGQQVTLFHQESDGSWLSPLLGAMDLDDFNEWLEFNDDSETKKYYDEGIAKLLEEATQPPTETPTETPPTEVQTVAPDGDASNACSQPLEPGDGGSLGKVGQVNFAWTEQPDAAYYIVTFVNENGSSAKIQTTDPNAEFYIEVLPQGGNYDWFVTAYGSDGSVLCTSASISFSKPQADPTEKPKSEKPGEGISPVETEDPACSLDQCASPSCPGYDSDTCTG